MSLLLLAVIYIVFISLGLPDGLLGSSWPAIRNDWSQPVELGGVIALIVTLMTIMSSLATSFLVRKMGIGRLLTASTALTAFTLLGFSQAPVVYWLFLLAVPLGLGAGAIDAALNDYVAKHYKAHHMNWLHAFWGVGATLGPIIFASSLASSGDWHSGYFTLGLIQASIVVILLLSLTLWSKVRTLKSAHVQQHDDEIPVTFSLLLKDRKVLYSFLTFLLYTGIEVGVGLWLASYLVSMQAIALETASLWTEFYYGAITIGRLLTGFVSFKVSSSRIIRFGLGAAVLGAFPLALHIHPAVSVLGIVLIGLGFAPIYPGLIHITPERFGKNKSAKVMSLQMVGGYIGASVIPPLIGFVSGITSLQFFALVTPVLLLLIILTTEILNRTAD